MPKKSKGGPGGGRRRPSGRPRPVQPVRRSAAPGGAGLAPAAIREAPEAEVEEEDGAPTAETGTDAADAQAAVAAVTPVPPMARSAVVPAGPPGVRRVGRVDPATRRPPPVRQPRQKPGPEPAAAALEPIDSEDAAIPLERVPYVMADLRRVGVIALAMIALIIVADVIVSAVVK